MVVIGPRHSPIALPAGKEPLVPAGEEGGFVGPRGCLTFTGMEVMCDLFLLILALCGGEWLASHFGQFSLDTLFVTPGLNVVARANICVLVTAGMVRVYSRLRDCVDKTAIVSKP